MLGSTGFDRGHQVVDSLHHLVQRSKVQNCPRSRLLSWGTTVGPRSKMVRDPADPQRHHCGTPRATPGRCGTLMQTKRSATLEPSHRQKGPRRLSRVDGHVVLCVLCVVSCMLCAMLCDVCDSTTEHAMFYVVCCVVLSAMCYVLHAPIVLSCFFWLAR